MTLMDQLEMFVMAAQSLFGYATTIALARVS